MTEKKANTIYLKNIFVYYSCSSSSSSSSSSSPLSTAPDAPAAALRVLDLPAEALESPRNLVLLRMNFIFEVLLPSSSSPFSPVSSSS